MNPSFNDEHLATVNPPFPMSPQKPYKRHCAIEATLGMNSSAKGKWRKTQFSCQPNFRF